MGNYARGSEWRKWDLHVHTPESIFHRYKKSNEQEDLWDKYINDLESLDESFAVLGINDYWFLDGYKKLLNEKKENGRLSNLTLFPVVEFRIKKFAGVDFKKLKRINLHIIFSPELTPDVIQSQFLNGLSTSYTLDQDGSQWCQLITRESLEDLGKQIKSRVPENELANYGSDLQEGFNNLNIDEEKIFSQLATNSCFKDKYMVAIGKTEWDEFKWTDNSILEKKSIINRSDIIFTASESIDKFNSAKQKLEEKRVNNLLLDCSDAHSFSSDINEKDRIGNCNTWIKADPTFEGLKQILYEPEERVKIQLNNPYEDFEKPYFSEITIQNNTNIFENDEIAFNQGAIPLNQNLVAVIGGRGEGKSALIKHISSFLNGYSLPSDSSINKSSDFNINYCKKNFDLEPEDTLTLNSLENSGELDFVYINQGELKKEIEDKKIFVESILKFSGINKSIFSEKVNEDVIKKAIQYFKLKNNMNVTIEKNGNKEITTKLNVLNKKKESLEKLIKTISTQENKEKLGRYTKFVNELNEIKISLDHLNLLKGDIDKVINETNLTIISLNKKLLPYGEDIPPVKQNNFNTQLDKIEIIKTKLMQKSDFIEEGIEQIVKDFSTYKGDLNSLLENAHVYQTDLTNINIDIQTVEEQLTEIEDIKKYLFSSESTDCCIHQLKTDYEGQIKKLDDEWESFKNVEDQDNNPIQKLILESLLKDLDVEGEIYFNCKNFYSNLSDHINGTFWKQKNNIESLKEFFKINDLESFYQYILNRLSDDAFENWAYSENFLRYFFDNKERAKYLFVQPIIRYSNKSITKLSDGQKGTVYLKIKLATEAFSKPIIFDQPEDDLDNKFIVNELVLLFKQQKKYRQMIIVTHNANLVVNADAEQIIVANNTDNKINYISGSLENPEINKKICEILEGGSDAFKKRRLKYQI